MSLWSSQVPSLPRNFLMMVPTESDCFRLTCFSGLHCSYVLGFRIPYFVTSFQNLSHLNNLQTVAFNDRSASSSRLAPHTMGAPALTGSQELNRKTALMLKTLPAYVKELQLLKDKSDKFQQGGAQ